MSEDPAVDHRGAERPLLVKGSTDVKGLGMAIHTSLLNGNPPVLRAIGAGAVNQALKGIIVARSYVAQRGLDLVVRPGFEDVKGHRGDDVSCMTLRVSTQ
jgi:stage V sporulation protein S